MKKVSIIVPIWNQDILLVKALDSVPRRDDIEVLCYDDGSTDRSLFVLARYANEHPEINIRVFHDSINRGCAYAKNRMLEHCSAEYFSCLDSDDYLYTDEYSKLIDNELDGTDLVCFDLQINDGNIWHVCDETKRQWCSQSIRFVRREFANGIRFQEDKRAGADYWYNEDCLKRNPTHKFTGIVAYHYNFPREGSIRDLVAKGIYKTI